MPATPFVGREEELQELRAAVADQEGKVVLVIGGEGRGKSALLAELNRRLAGDPLYFPLLRQLNSRDMSDAFLGRLMDDLLSISGLTKGKLVLGVPGQEQRWRDLLETATGLGRWPLVGPYLQPVSSVAGLLKQLVRDDKRPMRERFLHFLRSVASRLEGVHRLVLISDPDKYLDPSVEADWRTIAQQAPERVTIIFGQRPDDCLAGSPDFLTCRGVQCVPREELPYLPRLKSDDLVRTHWASREEWLALAAQAPEELLDLLWEKYGGWALPLTMALEDMPPRLRTMPDLLTAAKRMPPQLGRMLELRLKKARAASEDAVKVLRALAISGRPASFARIAAMHGGMVDEDHLEHVCADPAVARCLAPAERGTVTIFHATMAGCVLDTMGDETKRRTHRRAAALYAADLGANGQDLDALDQLPLHLWESGEDDAFLGVLDELTATKHRLHLHRSSLRDLQWACGAYRALARSRGREFLPHLAGHLNDLGVTLATQGRLSEALRAHEESLITYRRLARDESPAYAVYVATCLTNLANVRKELGDMPEAQSAYEEALSIRRRLAESGEAVHQENIAHSLGNLALLHSDLGRPADACQALEGVVSIYRGLVTTDPQTYTSGLGQSLSNLGAELRDLGRLPEALGYHEEALAIRRQLAQAEPVAFEPDLAVSLTNLGAVLSDLGRDAEAQQAQEEAVAIYQRLAQAEPAAYESSLVAALVNLAGAMHETGDIDRAYEALSQAAGIGRRLAETERRANRAVLALCLSNMARVALAVSLPEEAVACAHEALALYRELVAVQPMLLGGLATALGVVGAMEAFGGCTDSARAAFDESLIIFAEIASDTPTLHLRALHGAVRNAQRFLESTGQPLSSWPTLQRALEVIAECEAADPELAERLRRLREIHARARESA